MPSGCSTRDARLSPSSRAIARLSSRQRLRLRVAAHARSRTGPRRRGAGSAQSLRACAPGRASASIVTRWPSAEQPADEPVAPHRVDQPQPELAAVHRRRRTRRAPPGGFRAPRSSRASHVRLLRSDEFRPRLLRKREVEREMARARVVAFARFDEPLLRVLAHRFEQPIALAVRVQRHQRLLDEIA